MRVYIHCPGQDTGGQAYRIKRAFDRHHPEVAVRAMAVSPTYLAYPSDLMLYDVGTPLAQRLYSEADVVHLNNSVVGLRRLGMTRDKPMVIHHHGTQFRQDHARLLRDAPDATHLVSTIDLETLESGTTWLPSPFDLDELAALRLREYEPSRVLRIVHAPTDRTIKSTALLVKAVARLRARQRRVELDLIENAPWRECITRKARADIVFDQVVLGYGNNAVEAWGMGIPVVAGIDDAAVPGTRELMMERFGRLPFYEATEGTIEARLDELVHSVALRAEYGALGQAHARRWHDDRVVADQLLRVYGSLVSPEARGRSENGWGHEAVTS
jgi:hypothetical protein